jgi:hypothetical protein
MIALAIVFAGCWSRPAPPAPSRTPVHAEPPTTLADTSTTLAMRCPTAPARKPGCHGRDECVCIPGPLTPGGCGIPPNRQNACSDDAACGAGKICLAYTEGCNIGTRCAPACRADSCARGERCDRDGHCHPLPCDDGYDCSAYGACQIGDKTADSHGCVPFTCKLDTHCPCSGFCINEKCAGSQGECAVPRG